MTADKLGPRPPIPIRSRPGGPICGWSPDTHGRTLGADTDRAHCDLALAQPSHIPSR